MTTESAPLELEARNRLRLIVNRTTDLTPLKSVATKAIQIAEDERSAAMDLATVISSDQALTSKLLKLSNSAYYGYARRISNVREAVILLGMRTVRSVAISSGIIDAFNVPSSEAAGFDQDLFWAHSVSVGLVAELLARETRISRPEDAFTAGVLHDVGKLAMLLAEPKMFGDVIDLVNHEGMKYRDAELAVFQIGHEHVGARLAQRWKFPESLVQAIRDHHPAKGVAALGSMGDLIAAADLACNREGLACGFDFTHDQLRRPAVALPPAVDTVLNKVHGGMATIEEKARAFLVHVTSRAPRWYAPHHGELDGEEREESGAA
ncbi:MAG TPA: HDOD domain-containing protein [Tepidiformaceae bacterium]|nr:HDOD domain-containing protein [Tepidiformaceae bacterium]HNO65285.1 HDOD domain-containing protein [Tepidiformaceae bacterium]